MPPSATTWAPLLLALAGVAVLGTAVLAQPPKIPARRPGYWESTMVLPNAPAAW